MPAPKIHCKPVDGPLLEFESPDASETKELSLDNNGALLIDGKLVFEQYIRLVGISSIGFGQTSYVRNAGFYYLGSTAEGAITKVEVNAFRLSGSGTFDVRLRDRTNNLVIAELTVQSNADEADWLDLGTISNVPTGAALIGLDIKVSAGGTSVTVGATLITKG